MCDGASLPVIERAACAQKWLGVKLSDGRCGRSFVFSGEHSVYGRVSASDFGCFRCLISKDVGRALDYLCVRIPDGAVGTKEQLLAGCFAAALVNALMQRAHAPEELCRRGCAILPSADFGLFREGDCAVLVGAGMLLREAATSCTDVHVADMRDVDSFASFDMTADAEKTGPSSVCFHGPDGLDELLQDATVCCVTGCAIANGTFWSIARTLRERRVPVREFVLFGPTAQAPMEVLADSGVTRVVTSRVVRADEFMDSLADSLAGPSQKDCTESYAVDIRGIDWRFGR